MRIVHAPTEIAGQMGMLVRGLRRFGHSVNGYNWFHTYLKYQSGGVINTDAYELMKVIEPVVRYSDLLHFHNGNSFLIHNADIPRLADAGKPLVMQHWGNDVRTQSGAAVRNRYSIPPSYLSDDKIHARLQLLSRHIRHAIVQDYELYPYVSDYYEFVHVLPLACDTKEIPFRYPSMNGQKPVVIHAPTNKEFKGSGYIEQAIHELKGKHSFDYRRVERMSHAQAMDLYLTADIIVDQILCGTYGMLSVEAMAMGKVVVAYVNDEVRKKFPATLPIVVATPDTIGDVLAELLQQPEQRFRIGAASRAFAENVHDFRKVIPKLLDIYRTVRGASK
jgi:hypothetical protein